jgi:NAD(P)-dependent dehydrogenase (short-subunit alcohol dehydrogenase family)
LLFILDKWETVKPAGITSGLHTDAHQEYEIGRLDYAYNNAGVSSRSHVLLAEKTEEEFDRIISINLKGVFLCMLRSMH